MHIDRQADSVDDCSDGSIISTLALYLTLQIDSIKTFRSPVWLLYGLLSLDQPKFFQINLNQLFL